MADANNVLSILDQIKAVEEGTKEFAPFMQVINGSKGAQKENFGLFISKLHAEKVGFNVAKADGWVTHEHYFGENTEATVGYASQSPRLVIVRTGPLTMYDRNSGYRVDVFNKEVYDSAQHLLKTRYLVHVVNNNNEFVTEKPIILTTKTTFGASFGMALADYRKKFSTLIGAQKEKEFWALCVFQPVLVPELKGTAAKSWVTSVKSYVEPTADNIGQLFIGLDPAVKARMLKEYADSEAAFSIQSEVEAPVVAAKVQVPDIDAKTAAVKAAIQDIANDNSGTTLTEIPF